MLLFQHTKTSLVSGVLRCYGVLDLCVKRLRQRAAKLVQEERESLLRELHAELDSERKFFEERKPAILEEASGTNRVLCPPVFLLPKPKSLLTHFSEKMVHENNVTPGDTLMKLRLGSYMSFGRMDTNVNPGCYSVPEVLLPDNILSYAASIHSSLSFAGAPGSEEGAGFILAEAGA